MSSAFSFFLSLIDGSSNREIVEALLVELKDTEYVGVKSMDVCHLNTETIFVKRNEISIQRTMLALDDIQIVRFVKSVQLRKIIFNTM